MNHAPRVLMVCLGNYCRSPLAQGILKSKLKNSDIEVDSAGTAGWHSGSRPHLQSIKVAQQHGIDISNQLGRKLVSEDLDYFTHIYAMDRNNYQNIIDMCRNESQKSKVKMILENGQSVPDPYGQSDQGFLESYQLLNRACQTIADQLSNS
ncbi:MAG: low molecular weight phosphotyrosine protein phosphatase [Flavobacteriaceae bacterium]|nr:low molecular weight phosphotyrosine protein phosphatase [Flavobacteriaceae bacterium]MCY4215977.1 low molecular weight phosphotyrosine protein phosphatase [Flavobacteriaceae bacterium]MCY4253237.1 low molecular weight phosphotyrosine protein phosphatase [Flavobacteriaceae bacterium]